MPISEADRLLMNLPELGKFVLLARRFRNGMTQSAAARDVGIEPSTARRIVTRLEDALGVELCNELKKGAPTRDNREPRVVLTTAGEKLLEHAEQACLALAPLAVPSGPLPAVAPVRFVTTHDMLLVRLLRLAVEDLRTRRVVDLQPSLSRQSVSAALDPNEEVAPSGVAAYWTDSVKLRPGADATDARGGVNLLIVAESDSALRSICKPGRSVTEIDPKKVLASGEQLALPDWLRCDLPVGQLQKVHTFGDALFAVLSGTTKFGIVPALLATLDTFRAVGHLAYTSIPRAGFFGLPESVRITLARKVGGGTDDQFKKIVGAVEEALSRLPARSPFDDRATHRSLPDKASYYRLNGGAKKHLRTLHGYFVETLSGDGPHWRSEVLRLDPSTRGRGLTFEGDMVNDVGVPYAVTGGLMGSQFLYLIVHQVIMKNRQEGGRADSARRQVDAMIADWPEAKKLVPGGQVANEQPNPRSFLAFFPFYRPWGGTNVFMGWWMGRDTLEHALANQIIISEAPLTHSDRVQLSHDFRLRTVTAGFSPPA